MPISEFTNIVTIPSGATGITITQKNRFCYLSKYTVESRYLDLGFFEFCVTRSVYPNQKYILLLSLTIFWRWGVFYKYKLHEGIQN